MQTLPEQVPNVPQSVFVVQDWGKGEVLHADVDPGRSGLLHERRDGGGHLRPACAAAESCARRAGHVEQEQDARLLAAARAADASGAALACRPAVAAVLGIGVRVHASAATVGVAGGAHALSARARFAGAARSAAVAAVLGVGLRVDAGAVARGLAAAAVAAHAGISGSAYGRAAAAVLGIGLHVDAVAAALVLGRTGAGAAHALSEAVAGGAVVGLPVAVIVQAVAHLGMTREHRAGRVVAVVASADHWRMVVAVLVERGEYAGIRREVAVHVRVAGVATELRDARRIARACGALGAAALDVAVLSRRTRRRAAARARRV